MRRILATVALATAVMLAMPAGALAASGGLAAVRERVESSMLVKGDVTIEADGSVSALQLEGEDELPPGVVKLVRDSGMKWRFEPVIREGHAVRALAPMSLRVVAKKLEGDSYEISLRGINFSRLNRDDPENVASIDLRPPRYPEQAFRSGISGSVYLVLKVGRDGAVEDVFAEQVNLTFLSREGEQQRARELLARTSMATARNWKFRVPSQGPAAAQPFWSVRVPVAFSLNNAPAEGNERRRWVSYVPGPRQRAPWREDSEQRGFSPDALVDGSVNLIDERAPRLLTALQGE